jgi:hypothetical protein
MTTLQDVFVKIKNDVDADVIAEDIKNLVASGDLDVDCDYDDCVAIHEPANLLEFSLVYMRYDMLKVIFEHSKKENKKYVHILLRHIMYITDDLKNSIIQCKHYNSDSTTRFRRSELKNNLEFITNHASAILFLNNIIINYLP